MIPGAIKTDNTIIPVTQCGNGLGLITATDTGGKTICSKFNSSTFEKKASGLPNIFFFFFFFCSFLLEFVSSQIPTNLLLMLVRKKPTNYLRYLKHV